MSCLRKISLGATVGWLFVAGSAVAESPDEDVVDLAASDREAAPDTSDADASEGQEISPDAEDALAAPESEGDTGDSPAAPDIGYEMTSRPKGAGLADSLGRTVQPYGAIAGGLRFERLALRPDQDRRSRHPTVAVSRIGMQGTVGEYIRFRSEFEANLGGPLGYGASVWEGQAQMSVRDQYLQYNRWGWSFAAGRVTDSATVDFISAHVTDLLGTDAYVRDPLLFSGYDRGTGLFAKYEVIPGLRAGFTFHSTNPTGTTGTLLIGGELSPFDRPFYTAAAAVGRNEAMLPDQNLHLYFATPSVEYEDDYVQFRSAMQTYSLDTQMSSRENETIRGYNLRASGRVKLLDGRVSPFLNLSQNENEMLGAGDSTRRRVETYRAYTVSGGVDFNYWDKGGLGIQFAQLGQQRGDIATRRIDRYFNIGHTFWIEDGVSIGLRYAAFLRNDNNRESDASLLGFSGTGGHQSFFITSRLLL